MDEVLGFTVRLTDGRVPGTIRVTFFWGSTWITTFHTCGDTIGPGVVRRGHEEAELRLRPRVAVVLAVHRAYLRTLERLANEPIELELRPRPLPLLSPHPN
ncbi:MAG: hypothetical protein ABIT01_01320 [Thermoanaerobaculia bacterium]